MRHALETLRLTALACLAALSSSAAVRADGGFYCKARLVSPGAAPYEVRTLCGAPDDTQHRTEVRSVRRAVSVACATGYCTSFVEDNYTVNIEEWIYDFGPQRFVQYLTFEQGKLVHIRSGNYGKKLQ